MFRRASSLPYLNDNIVVNQTFLTESSCLVDSGYQSKRVSTIGVSKSESAALYLDDLGKIGFCLGDRDVRFLENAKDEEKTFVFSDTSQVHTS